MVPRLPALGADTLHSSGRSEIVHPGSIGKDAEVLEVGKGLTRWSKQLAHKFRSCITKHRRDAELAIAAIDVCMR